MCYIDAMFGFKAPVSVDDARIDELLTRGVAEILPGRESLAKLLKSGKRLRIKLGIDPTSPNLHIGRSIPLLKLRDFQNLGHQVVFIIGDATGVVGDTSDKDAERPMLEDETVKKNLETYVAQVGKILDRSKLEIRKNSEWLLKLNYRDIGEHASLFSVADFIARDNVRKRLDEGKRVSLREVLYPLMQGYDSVAVQADVELGGTDQKFNLLAGRTLQEKNGQAPQHVLMTDLILGTDGRKMSSSWGNTINLTDSPAEIFDKVLNIPDSLITVYFTHATRVPTGEIEKILSGHPKEAKLALAHEFVRMYHDQAAADKARDNSRKISEGAAPSENKTAVVFKEGDTYITGLESSGKVASRGAARNLVNQGGVFSVVSGEKITDPNAPLPDGEVVRLGKSGTFIEFKKEK